VMEKYENAIKVHDSIAKRRQSIDVGYLFKPLTTSNKNFERSIDTCKMRRFSVPNKPRPKSNHLQPPVNKLETLTDEELEDYEENDVSLNDANNNDVNNNQNTSLSILKQSIRKKSITPTPYSDRSPVIMKKLSLSMEDLTSMKGYNKQSSIRNSRLSHCYIPSSRYHGVTNTSIPYRKRAVVPCQQRYLEAKLKYENRKSLLTSLDMDIHKVALILRKMKSRSLPSLLETDIYEKQTKLIRSSTFDDTL